MELACCKLHATYAIDIDSNTALDNIRQRVMHMSMYMLNLSSGSQENAAEFNIAHQVVGATQAWAARQL